MITARADKTEVEIAIMMMAIEQGQREAAEEAERDIGNGPADAEPTIGHYL